MARRTGMSDEQKYSKVMALRAQGKTPTEIVRSTGVNKKLVSYYLYVKAPRLAKLNEKVIAGTDVAATNVTLDTKAAKEATLKTRLRKLLECDFLDATQKVEIALGLV